MDAHICACTQPMRHLDEARIMAQPDVRTTRTNPHQVEVFAPADTGELLHRRELLCKYAFASAPDPVRRRSVSSTIARASIGNNLTYSILVRDLL